MMYDVIKSVMIMSIYLSISGIIAQNLLYPFFRSFSTYFIVKITAIYPL